MKAIKRRFFAVGMISAAISVIVGGLARPRLRHATAGGSFGRETNRPATPACSSALGVDRPAQATDRPAQEENRHHATHGVLWAVTFDGQLDCLGSTGNDATDAAGGPVEVYADQTSANKAAEALTGPGMAVTDDAGRPASVSVRKIAWRFVE